MLVPAEELLTKQEKVIRTLISLFPDNELLLCEPKWGTERSLRFPVE